MGYPVRIGTSIDRHSIAIQPAPSPLTRSAAMSPTIWPTTFPFDNSSTLYRSQTALGLAQAAHLAYAPKPAEIQRVATDWGFSHVSFFPVNPESPPEAYLIADTEKIIVVFRGSDSLWDWSNNLDLDLIGGPLGGKIHEGFDRLLTPLWRDIQQTINQLKAEARTQNRSLALWLTGHSRGAALATIAVAKLREKDNPIHGLYTFGSPRVGDRDFVRYFNVDVGKRTYRIVNQDDLVTRLPPRKLGYDHVGQIHFLDANCRLHKDPSLWYRFLDSVEVTLEDFLNKEILLLKHHDINCYRDALTQTQSRLLV
jgi:triacylglycerol lipase